MSAFVLEIQRDMSSLFVVLMRRRPTRSTRTDTPVPYTTRFRSPCAHARMCAYTRQPLPAPVVHFLNGNRHLVSYIGTVKAILSIYRNLIFYPASLSVCRRRISVSCGMAGRVRGSRQGEGEA